MKRNDTERVGTVSRLRAQRRTHSEDGVDLTLIRWMLSLTPEERVKTLENNIYALARLRNGSVAT